MRAYLEEAKKKFKSEKERNDKSKDADKKPKPGLKATIVGYNGNTNLNWRPLESGPSAFESGEDYDCSKFVVKSKTNFVGKSKPIKESVSALSMMSLTSPARLKMIMDTGALESIHGEEVHMVNYRESKPGTHFMETADGTCHEVKGYGDFEVIVKNHEGNKVEATITDVLHVPGSTGS